MLRPLNSYEVCEEMHSQKTDHYIKRILKYALTYQKYKKSDGMIEDEMIDKAFDCQYIKTCVGPCEIEYSETSERIFLYPRNGKTYPTICYKFECGIMLRLENARFCGKCVDTYLNPLQNKTFAEQDRVEFDKSTRRMLQKFQNIFHFVSKKTA